MKKMSSLAGYGYDNYVPRLGENIRFETGVQKMFQSNQPTWYEWDINEM